MKTFFVIACGLALTLGTASVALTMKTASVAQASDSPSGFWYGTDSWHMPVSGSGPYNEPAIGGRYGGYIGMAGNWARQLGCSTGNFFAWDAVNENQARVDYTIYHLGVGVGVYWYMGGPGVDPHYNGTATEASAWGARQAAWTLAAAKADDVDYKVMWADIEFPGIAPAPDNGWNSVYTSPCSGVKRINFVPAAVDRAEFNGFAAYVTSHAPAPYTVGVYSSAGTWSSIFGAGTVSLIPNTYEWTYEPESASLSRPPAGWCLSGTSTCAVFFGGQTSASKYALAWQWSGGGGVRNAYGDFDQIDAARYG